MTGFGVLLRKELDEAWRTRRLPVVAGLFIVVGMLSPLTARYLREIMQAALGDQLAVPIPEPTAVMAVEQLQKNLAQLGALVAIALAMGSVSGELDRGTASLVLAQPVTRTSFLAAKLTSIAVVLGVAVALAGASAWTYTAVLFEPQPVGGWVAMTLLSWLALCAWASLTFLASAATGSTTAAAGLGFVALVVISLGAILPAVDRLLPTGLAAPGIRLASGARARWSRACDRRHRDGRADRDLPLRIAPRVPSSRALGIETAPGSGAVVGCPGSAGEPERLRRGPGARGGAGSARPGPPCR